jgi:hypothetical protein
MSLMKRVRGDAKEIVHWGPTRYDVAADGTVDVREDHVSTAIAAGFEVVEVPMPVERIERKTLHLKK